jgi:hypothetical protein
MHNKKYSLKIIYDRKIDILLFVLLIGLGIKYVFHIESFIDIYLYDESGYLYRGINLFQLGLPNAQLAPFYSLWYYILSLIVKDSISIYFLNLKILTTIIPVLLFLVFRRYRIPKLPSFLVAYFFLISSGNFLTFPKVSHFAISLILFSILISTFSKKSNLKLAIIIIGALFSSYVRPELFLSFIILLIYYVFKIIMNKTNFREFKTNIILGLTILLSFIVVGIPFINGNRGFDAFSQHFALNWVKWNNSKLSPMTNTGEIINQSFGKINSVWGALISNYKLFFKHILDNISWIKFDFMNLFNHTSILLPNYSRFSNLESLSIIVTILLFAGYKIYISKTSMLNYIKNNLKERKELFIICFVYIIPVFLSVIIIYPSAHYLIMMSTILMIILLSLLYSPSKVKPQIGNIKFLLLIIFSIALIILTPHSSKLIRLHDNQYNLSVIKYLRSLNIKTKVNLLEAEGGYNIYLGSNYNRVPEYAKNTNFNEFLIQKNINMIILSGTLSTYNKFSSDSSWLYFIDNYNKYGFSKKEISNNGIVIFIKKSLKVNK